jgi:pectinesterase
MSIRSGTELTITKPSPVRISGRGMPVAFPPPDLLLTVFLAFVVSTGATAKVNSALAPAPAGSRFLWTCCVSTTNASVCYDSLLPIAASFHGNRVKVASAAAAISFARHHSFYDELRRLQPEGTSAGRLADMTLGDCATFADLFLG